MSRFIFTIGRNFLYVMLLAVVTLPACKSKLSVDIASSQCGSNCSGQNSPAATPAIETNDGSLLTWTGPGDPVSFAVSPENSRQANIAWARAPSAPTGLNIAQSVLFYDDNDSTCSSSPMETLAIPSSATSVAWDRFAHAVSGLVRFKILATASDKTQKSSACSGTIFLHNGIMTLTGTLANLNLKYANSADLNGDGVLDIVASNPSYDGSKGVIAVFPSIDGELRYGSPHIYTGDNSSDQLGRNIVLADVTGDGKQDIISSYNFTNGFTGSIYVIPGSSILPNSGSLAAVGLRYNGDGTNDRLGTNLQIADLNADGISDIVSSWNSSASTPCCGSVYVIKGATSLPASGTITTRGRRYDADANDDIYATKLVLRDVTGDGRLDLVTLDSSSGLYGCVSIIPMTASMPASGAVATVGKVYCASSGGAMGITSTFGDFNGDGIDDIAVGGHSQVNVLLGSASLPNTGTISTAWTRSYSGVFPSMIYGEALQAADLNGDGKKDLIVNDRAASPSAKAAAGSVYVILGAAALPANGTVASAAARRYDGDIAGDNLNFAASVSGRGSGFADINGDGYVDMVSSYNAAAPGGRTNAGSIYVLFGGSALAASGAISTAGRRYDGASANDNLDFFGLFHITGDTKVDLVWKSSHSSHGSFGIIPSATSMPANGLVGSVGVEYSGTAAGTITGIEVNSVDLNNDGFVDLVLSGDVATTNAGHFCVLSGSGTLPASTDILTAGASCFAGNAANDGLTYDKPFTDINADGSLDIVVKRSTTAANANQVDIVYSSTALQGLTMTSVIKPEWGDGTNALTTGPMAADLDQDGKPDLIWSVSTASPNGISGAGEVSFIPGTMVYPK